MWTQSWINCSLSLCLLNRFIKLLFSFFFICQITKQAILKSQRISHKLKNQDLTIHYFLPPSEQLWNKTFYIHIRIHPKHHLSNLNCLLVVNNYCLVGNLSVIADSVEMRSSLFFGRINQNGGRWTRRIKLNWMLEEVKQAHQC